MKDSLRKNLPKALIVTDDETMFETAIADDMKPKSPEAEMIAKSESAQLTATIAALPLAFREVLVLRDIDGLSYREIAAVVSLPMGTVMSRLSRARKLLVAAIAASQTTKQGAA